MFSSLLYPRPYSVFGAFSNFFYRVLASTLADPSCLFGYLLRAAGRNFGCLVGGMSGVSGDMFRTASGVFADCFYTFAYVLCSLGNMGATSCAKPIDPPARTEMRAIDLVTFMRLFPF